MKAESKPSWLVLEKLLLRDWWDSELACRIFTGFVHIDRYGDYVADSGRPCIFDLDTGEENWQTDFADAELSFNSSRIYEIKNSEWEKHQMLWKYSRHDRSSSNLQNEDEWSKEYCVRWALSKRIDIPWLDWAIEKGYLPAEIREDKETKKPDTPMSDSEEMQWKVLAAVFFEMLTHSDQANHHFKDAAQLGKVIDATYGVQFPNKGLKSRTLETKFAKLNALLKELRS